MMLTSNSNVLVIGSQGQVARSLAMLKDKDINFICIGRDRVNILCKENIIKVIEHVKPALLINTAAYTNVERAEIEQEQAMLLNCQAPAYLAELCNLYSIPLLHLSTDYVFDGSKKVPYTTEDTVNPLNFYGLSKEAGERAIRNTLEKHIILRTSWLFSPYGHNFLKTIVNSSCNKENLNIVNDQYGCPTSALDLAQVILLLSRRLLNKKAKKEYGTFHYCNKEVTSWYGFAKDIRKILSKKGHTIQASLQKIKTEEYPTLAKRPLYSVLDCSKIQEFYDITQANWIEIIDQSISELEIQERT